MIRVATRASALALAQARTVAERLESGGARVQIVSMRTEGDRRAEARLAAVGGKGLFVREIEEALLRGDADVAVHSLKDLPADLPPGLTLAVFPERDDARDVLVTRDTAGLDALPRGAVIGTSSPRRRAIVLSLRPDLVVTPIRGNVDTRLAKLATREWDAVLLAAAGLRRLGLAPQHATPLAPDVFVPAVGQGVLGVEARADDMAAHARHAEGRVVMDALVLSEDGREVLREHGEGPAADAAAVGRRVAEALLARGAASVVALRPVEVSGGR